MEAGESFRDLKTGNTLPAMPIPKDTAAKMMRTFSLNVLSSSSIRRFWPVPTSVVNSCQPDRKLRPVDHLTDSATGVTSERTAHN